MYALPSSCVLAANYSDSVDTSIIGPVTVMESYKAQFGPLAPAVHGIIISCTLLPAAVSSFFAGRPADSLGRPRALALGAAVFALGAVLQAGAVSLAMFAVGRVTEGLGYGVYFGTQTVYVATPDSRRTGMRCRQHG
jgi:MFS family permease